MKITRTLNLPLLVRTSTEVYAIVEGSTKGKVTLIFTYSKSVATNKGAGHTYKDHLTETDVIRHIDRGAYTVLSNNPFNFIEEGRSKDISTLSLKIETDSSDFTEALSGANTQAKELLNTLTLIRNIFNKD